MRRRARPTLKRPAAAVMGHTPVVDGLVRIPSPQRCCPAVIHYTAAKGTTLCGDTIPGSAEPVETEEWLDALMCPRCKYSTTEDTTSVRQALKATFVARRDRSDEFVPDAVFRLPRSAW